MTTFKSAFNLSLLCDFYEFTMANGYLKTKLGEKICYFDVFFRQIPDGGGFVIAAGLSQIIEFVKNLHFYESDIEFFRQKKLFDEDFLTYLKNFNFQGDIYAVKEGEIVFANEPILTVRASAAQAQLLETFILLSLNHQSLIATKAARIVRAAHFKPVLEFGSRRAQGIDAALSGARAAFIGGVAGSACALADKLYGINSSGTMAHSWVQMFEDECEAFKRYCEIYPHNAILLVDTYNVKNGIKNAIKAFKEVLVPRGIEKFGIRLDSGNLCELSKYARNELDKANLQQCQIIASGALDEFEIHKLLKNGAKIDIFGVGERLITAKSSPVLGCVYKLVAVEENNQIVPKIKISENSDKISNPHYKRLYRFFDKGKAAFDELFLEGEKLPLCQDYKELLVPIFQKGKLVYEIPSLLQTQNYAKTQLNLFDEAIKDLENPSNYELRLSSNLQKLKKDLLESVK